MATFEWYGQNASGTVALAATDRIGFASASAPFPSSLDYGPVWVGAYPNLTYRAKNTDGSPSGSSSYDYGFYANQKTSDTTLNRYHADLSDLATPTAFNLVSVPSSSCALCIVFSHGSSVATQSGQFWAYDGTSDANDPVGVVCYAFESGAAAWSAIAPSSKLSLADQSSSTTHTFYLGVSATPSAAGSASFAYKISLEYY